MAASATFFRLWSFVYGGLSLTGSLILLCFRKDLATAENDRQFIHLFALLWLIFNFTLIYGLCVSDTTFVRIHLHFVTVMYWLLDVAFFVVGFSILGVLLGVIDETDIPWRNKAVFAWNVSEIMVLLYFVCCVFLYLVYWLIKCILQGYIDAIKSEEEFQVSINIEI